MESTPVDRKVLEIAKEGEYFEGDIPVDEQELAEQATYFCDEAVAAWKSGMRDPFVGRILVEIGYISQNEFEEAMAVGEIVETESEEDEIERQPLPGDDPEPTQIIRRVQNSAPEAETEWEGWMRENKLPIPTPPEGEPWLPSDPSSLDDLVLRKLHSRNNDYLSRARWLLAIEMGKLINAEKLRDEAYRVALLKVNRIDPKTDKAKSVAMVDAEAKDDIEYQDWAAAANKHEIEVVKRKALVDMYQGNVALCSREWTMRTEQWERSRVGGDS